MPSEANLLLAVKRAVGDMISSNGNDEHVAALRTIDISINELLLRQDNSFYLRYYHDGADLLRQAVEAGLAPASDVGDLPARLGPETSSQAIEGHTRRIIDRLAAVVAAIGAPDHGDRKSFLDAITDWEISLYRHRMTEYPSDAPAATPLRFSRETLQVYLRDKFPDHAGIEVTGYHRIFGGYSKLTIMFSTDRPIFDCTEFVIRAELASIITHSSGTSDNEFAVMRYAFEQGIRIPEALWVELDRDRLGARFVVSRRARGSIYGTTAGATTKLSRPVLQDLVRELVKIHSVRIDPDDPLVQQSHLAAWAAIPNLQDNVLKKFDYWRKIIADSPHTASPLIERCLNWMAANNPATDDAPTLVHGDYGLHNILIDDGHVSGVLDWEITHFGDRAQDIIFLIICLTGTASYDEVLRLYEEAGGRPVSQERLRFYDVYYSFALLVVCNVALARIAATGQNPTLAEFGLRYTQFFADRVNAEISR